MRKRLAALMYNSLCRVAKRQKMPPNRICGSQKCPRLYRMFDTKTFINKTSFIRIFIGVEVIRYYLAVANFVTLTAFSHSGLLSANKQSLTCCFDLQPSFGLKMSPIPENMSPNLVCRFEVFCNSEPVMFLRV